MLDIKFIRENPDVVKKALQIIQTKFWNWTNVFVN